ncbi:hypothetical protein ABL78_7820 [Leptomonas seymouri]|uniref:CH-like domain-containing protein n=1 Tax=Leptomonas seymouri TaxID=5684 RepID=A0A0N1IGR4_LEPSE|nr:hypothetical protein ABL78_7820 [Leptomonas seymouri]|eukprot:KPI83153.1 hypothetical protein ABL78_7820 [Leptomonas seymouri]
MASHVKTHSQAASPAATPGVPTYSLCSTAGALPREVLMWLQSLSLTNTVKNPRRDLANGYVIAQICANYWAHVPLHSFSNGASTSSKQSNWYVLQKVMRKHDIEISPAMVEGMMNGSEGFAAAFLKQLYTVFTGKAMEEVPVPLAEPLVEVPSKDVPVLTPSTATKSASRARQAAESAFLTGPSRSSLPSPSSRLNMMQKGSNTPSFGVAGASEAFFHGGSGTSGQAARALPVSRTATTAAATLPPIVPPPPAPVASPGGQTATGKPVLGISVRPAGLVSTVLPAAAGPRPSTASAVATSKERGTEQTHPPGTSLAVAWFCAKVHDAPYAEALEAFANSYNSEVASASSPLTTTLMWLSAAEGVLKSDLVYGGEGDETTKESQMVLRQRAWQSLLSSVHELAELVVRCAAHGLDVVVDSMFTAVCNTAVCDGEGRELCSGVLFVRNTLQLCASLLAHISDVDCHYALRCFHVYFVASSAFAAAVRQMKWCVAKDYAKLIVTALPPNRGTAAGVLEQLWSSVESAVRDAAVPEVEADDETNESIPASSQAEASLLTLLRALVETLLPYHSGAAFSHIRSSPPPSVTAMNANGAAGLAGPSSPDGTRPSFNTTRSPSQRIRGIHAASTGAAAVEEDVFDNVVARMAHERCTSVLRQLPKHHATLFDLHEAALAETAVALAVDLLRVELKSCFAAELVCGEPFVDVFRVLFPPVVEDGGNGNAKAESPKLLFLKNPALSVLRARWLRWCLQRRWQYGLLTGRPTALALQPSQRRVCSPNGSIDGPSDGEIAAAVSDKESWLDSDEVHALCEGLQVVCMELFAALDPESQDERDALTRRKAKILMACAMAESLPLLPSQYTATETDAARSSEGEGEGEVVAKPLCAEAVAEAALHVFTRETLPAEMHSLLRAAPQGPTKHSGTVDEHEDGATVILTHPLVGSLEPYGPLVLRSDVLLLVKALLCVLDYTSASTGKAAATGGKDVAAVARRLGARAAIVAREGQVEESLAVRIAWMHALLVEGRRAPASAPTTATIAPSSVSAAAASDAVPSLLLSSSVTEALARRSQGASHDDAVISQWHSIILECWDTFMMVLQAATLRLRQRGGASTAGPTDGAGLREALGEELLACAQQAQEVVCCLERELSSALPGRSAAASADVSTTTTGRGDGVTLNSALLSGPMSSFVLGAAAEVLQAAVGWMWNVVGGS